MQTFSLQQKLFALIATTFTLLFFTLLNSFVTTENWNAITVCASLYAILMFGAGLITGYFDNIRKQRIDLGWRYHWITYVVVNITYLIYGILTGAKIFGFVYFLLHLTGWGFGLTIHFLVARKSIKGYSSKELFG